MSRSGLETLHDGLPDLLSRMAAVAQRDVLVGIPEDFFLFVCFFFKLTDSLADLLFRQYKLCGRVDSDAFQLRQ